MYKIRRRQLSFALITLTIAALITTGLNPQAFADTPLPSGFSSQNSSQVDFYTVSQSNNGGQDYVQVNQWWYFGTSLTSCSLTNLGYYGNCNPEAVLVQGEISANGNWCEDTGGLQDGQGPSMVLHSYLYTPLTTDTDIINNSPSGSYSYDPQGTIDISIPVGALTLGGSYNVPKIQGQLNQNSPYTDFTTQQALNQGGCDTAAYYWDFSQGLMSAANRCCWPQYEFDHFSTVTGNFWQWCFFGGICGDHPQTGVQTAFSGTG